MENSLLRLNKGFLKVVLQEGGSKQCRTGGIDVFFFFTNLSASMGVKNHHRNNEVSRYDMMVARMVLGRGDGGDGEHVTGRHVRPWCERVPPTASTVAAEGTTARPSLGRSLATRWRFTALQSQFQTPTARP